MMRTGSKLDLFSFLTNILRLKSQSVYSAQIADESFESLYVPFMIVKWLSMVNDKDVVEALSKNHTTLDELADDKELHYRFLMTVIPKSECAPRWVFERKKASTK